MSFNHGGSGGTEAELRGVMRVHVHYYEDGNVQLVSSKDFKQTLMISVRDDNPVNGPS